MLCSWVFILTNLDVQVALPVSWLARTGMTYQRGQSSGEALLLQNRVNFPMFLLPFSQAPAIIVLKHLAYQLAQLEQSQNGKRTG